MDGAWQSLPSLGIVPHLMLLARASGAKDDKDKASEDRAHDSVLGSPDGLPRFEDNIAHRGSKEVASLQVRFAVAHLIGPRVHF